MDRRCVRCGSAFEAARPRAYCDACRAFFREAGSHAADAATPRPGVHLSGRFLDHARCCPSSAFDPATGSNACGLCGGEAEPGYGFAGGFGLGGYNFCLDCGAILDFSPDTGE